MKRTRIHVTATLIAIAFAIALPASADYKQAFREGVRAYEKKQWQVVVANMNSAIEQQARSSERINISGGWNEPYAPHYFLAAALANLGQCDEAATAFRNGGGLPGGDKYRAVVESKCGKINTGPTPAELELARKQEEARKAEEARKQEDARKAEAARIAEENRKAEAARIAEDNRKAEAARVAAEETRKAEAARIAEANKNAEDNRKAEEARKAEDARKAEETRKAEEAKLAAARIEEAKRALTLRVADGRGFLASASMGNAQARASLNNAMSASVRAIASNSLPALQGASVSLERAIKDVLATSSGDGKLREAVTAYLRGNYADTVAMLASANFTNAAMKGQAALFRAAANFALRSMNGSKDPQLSTRIVEDVSEYRRQQPGAAPDVRVFSPAFRAFVSQTAAR